MESYNIYSFVWLLSHNVILKKKRLIYSFFFRGGEQEEGRAERERENLRQTPIWAQSLKRGLISWPWDNDMSRNHELDAWWTEPPRCSSHMCFCHSSILLCQSIVHSFLLLCNITLCECTIIFFSSPLFMHIWVVSSFGLLWVKLP